MRRGTWFDSAGQATPALERYGAVALAAAAGAPLGHLLELAASNLLQTGGGDRAVVWIISSDMELGKEVRFAGSVPSPLPEDWQLFDPASVVHGPQAETGEPWEMDRMALSALPPNGPLSDVESVVWIPLRVRSMSFGMAMVAATRAGFAFAIEPLKRLAAELSVALAEECGRRQADLARAETLMLFESAGEALVIVDDQGSIKQANRRARDVLRLTAQRTPQPLLEELFADSGRDGVTRWLEAARSAPAPGPAEGMLETGFVLLLQRRAILGDGLLICLEDRQVSQRAEERWKQVEAELRSVLDSVDGGILLLDLTGRIRFANARFAQFFGLSSPRLSQIAAFEDLARLVESRFSHPGAFAGPRRASAEKAGEAVQDELEMVRPGHKVLERFSRPVLDPEGRRLGWLEHYRDITSQRQLQSKLVQTEKMAAVGQLVSGIAHELNNPLTAIMGYAQLLLGHGLRPAQLSEAKKIFQEAERARRIVKNLLFFAREAKPERTRVDLNEIVERTLALRSYELKIENIVVECSLADSLPPTLADPYQLQQVVLNLLVNAEQAILQGRGHGRIAIHTRRLTGDRLALEVADDGPGIPREIASRVFDPFFTTKPPGVGTGLGLSIVYGIVKEHAGEVYVESPRGGGAKFIVELPIVAVSAKNAAPKAPESDSLRHEVHAGRILVVEDEPAVAQLIVDVLRGEGHHVDSVLDSQEALARLSRGRYDLVLSDLRMPRLDGRAFYEALVNAGSPMRDRIIFTTGDTLAPSTLEFVEKYGLPFLAKPFLVEELKLAVHRMLEPHPAAASAGADAHRARPENSARNKRRQEGR
ncbi:MAG TPA: ATP-binding protein [Candidatus Acidoferrales bacterium]|nr:ATP-binding protein [Candidatus Acidoferrales bacterium]